VRENKMPEAVDNAVEYVYSYGRGKDSLNSTENKEKLRKALLNLELIVKNSIGQEIFIEIYNSVQLPQERQSELGPLQEFQYPTTFSLDPRYGIISGNLAYEGLGLHIPTERYYEVFNRKVIKSDILLYDIKNGRLLDYFIDINNPVININPEKTRAERDHHLFDVYIGDHVRRRFNNLDYAIARDALGLDVPDDLKQGLDVYKTGEIIKILDAINNDFQRIYRKIAPNNITDITDVLNYEGWTDAPLFDAEEVREFEIFTTPPGPSQESILDSLKENITKAEKLDLGNKKESYQSSKGRLYILPNYIIKSNILYESIKNKIAGNN